MEGMRSKAVRWQKAQVSTSAATRSTQRPATAGSRHIAATGAESAVPAQSAGSIHLYTPRGVVKERETISRLRRFARRRPQHRLPKKSWSSEGEE